MNFAEIIGIAGVLAGIFQAAFSLGMSRSPGRPELRPFALVSALAAAFCAFDLALVLDLPAPVVVACIRISTACGVFYGVSWLWYLAAAGRRPLLPAERWVSALGMVLGVGSLLPGVVITGQIVAIQPDWLGITYRIPQPTTPGAIGIACFSAGLVMVVTAGAWGRRHEGWQATMPILGVAALGLLALNDTLASTGQIPMPLLLDGGSVLLVVVTGLLHQQRFATDAHRLETSSARLEQEVELRSRELLEAHAALARSERLAGLGRLAAGVAHEINNPAAVIQHNLEQLRLRNRTEGEFFPGASKQLEASLAATQRIVRIVRQLLETGRASDLDPGRRAPFALLPVIQQAVEMTRGVVGTREVSVQVEDELAAMGDAAIVEQVLVNLLINAAHALEERVEGGRIEIRAGRRNDRARVSVRDNGPGIDPAVRARLFEPFVTSKPVGKGSGLGLAVSHGLMRSMQGELILVSTSSEGTEIALELDWSPSAPIPAPLPPEEIAVPAAPSAIGILIIDDDDELREALADAARDYFRVDAARTIDEAIARLERDPAIDVVLCDLMMPDGGVETWLRRCAEVKPLLTKRTILITGGPTTRRATELVEEYRDRVLFKPFALTTMQSMVLRLVSASGRTQPAAS